MNHLKTHQREEVYMCGFCGQIFQKALFPQHLKTHRKEAEEEKARQQALVAVSNDPSNTNVNANATSPVKVSGITLPPQKGTPRRVGVAGDDDKEKSYLVKSHQVTLPNQQVATVIDLGNLLNVAMNADTLGQEESAVRIVHRKKGNLL